MQYLQLISEWGFVFTAVVAVILFLISQFMSRYGEIPVKELIKDKSNWPQIISKHNKSRSESFYLAIRSLNRKIVNFYGENILGLEAFMRCFQIAIYYPLVALFCGWVISPSFSFGGLIELPATPELHQRIWTAFLLLMSMGYGPTLFHFFGRQILNLLETQAPTTPKVPWWKISTKFILALKSLLRSLAAITLGASPFFVGVLVSFWTALPPVLTGMVVLVGAFAYTRESLFSFFVLWNIFFFSLLLLVGPFSSEADAEFLSFSLLVFSILPLFNATADWISLAATRYFFSNHSIPHGIDERILIRVFLDVLIACTCFVLLCASCILFLEIWYFIFPKALALDWRIYLSEIAAREPGRLIPILLMAATTMIPSIVHLLIGLSAYCTAESRATKKAIDILTSERENAGFNRHNEVIGLLRKGALLGYCRASLLVVAPFLMILVLTYII